MKRCPGCGTEFPDESAFCPSCGMSMRRMPGERRLIFCRHCGSKIPEEYECCPACGRSQAVPGESEISPTYVEVGGGIYAPVTMSARTIRSVIPPTLGAILGSIFWFTMLTPFLKMPEDFQLLAVLTIITAIICAILGKRSFKGFYLVAYGCLFSVIGVIAFFVVGGGIPGKIVFLAIFLLATPFPWHRHMVKKDLVSLRQPGKGLVATTTHDLVETFKEGFWTGGTHKIVSAYKRGQSEQTYEESPSTIPKYAPPSASVAGPVEHCMYCGREIPAGSRICPYCGKEVVGVTPTQKPYIPPAQPPISAPAKKTIQCPHCGTTGQVESSFRGHLRCTKCRATFEV